MWTNSVWTQGQALGSNQTTRPKRVTWQGLSPDIVRVIQSSTMRLLGDEALAGGELNCMHGLVGKPKDTDHLAFERDEWWATETNIFTAIYTIQAIPSNLFHICFNIILSSISISSQWFQTSSFSPNTPHPLHKRHVSDSWHPYFISLPQ